TGDGHPSVRRVPLDETSLARSVAVWSPSVLRVAIQAPTGGNSQGWRWLVLDDPERKAQIGTWYRAGTDVLAASAAYAKDEQSARVYKAAEYLASVLEQVPVLVIPCVQGRL